jgi:hypothetical protein
VETRFGPDVAITPYTIGRYPGVSAEDQFTDALCNRLQIDWVAGQYLKATGNWMCRVHSLNANVSPTFPGGVEYTWNQASLSIAGAAWVNWEQVTITIDNQLKMVPTLDGTLSNRRILRDGYRLFRFSATADMPDNTEFSTFRAGTEQNFTITTQGLTISSGNVETLKIEVPNFRYTAFPIAVTGPHRITVNLQGRAVYNQNSGLAFIATVVNTRVSY